MTRLVNAAADIAAVIVHDCDCDVPHLPRINQHIAFLVPFACCSNELMARHSAAAVAIACVTYSARLFGDHQAELALIPASVRAAVGGAAAVALEDLRSACRIHGHYLGDAAAVAPLSAPEDDWQGEEPAGFEQSNHD